MARDLRIALVGFGNVGRRFAEQLRGPYARVLRAAGARVRVTGIATARHGIAVDARGLELGRALRLVAKGQSLERLHRGPPADVRAFIARVPADVLVEVTTLDPRSGRPAIDHVRQALGRGLHVITANKGPVAFALRPLRAWRPGRSAVPARGRGDGRDAGLQPGRALPARRARPLVPRHAQQHEQPRALAHGGGPDRERRAAGRRRRSGSPRRTRGTTSTAGTRR